MKLCEIVICTGLSDIKHNRNSYGVARNLLTRMLEYRLYESFYDDIKAGFVPPEEYNPRKALYWAARGNQRHIIDMLVRENLVDIYRNDDGLSGAIDGDHFELVKWFLSQCKMSAIFWDINMRNAARYCSKELFEYLIQYMETCKELFITQIRLKNGDPFSSYKLEQFRDIWNIMLEGAAIYGDMSRIQYCIDKGASNWNRGMHGAARGGHIDIFQFFVDKTTQNYDYVLCYVLAHTLANAVRSESKELIKRCMDNLVKSSNPKQREYHGAMLSAIQTGSLELVEMFIDKVDSIWSTYMSHAARYGKKNLVMYFLNKGPCDMMDGLLAAISSGHRELITFFQEETNTVGQSLHKLQSWG